MGQADLARLVEDDQVEGRHRPRHLRLPVGGAEFSQRLQREDRAGRRHRGEPALAQHLLRRRAGRRDQMVPTGVGGGIETRPEPADRPSQRLAAPLLERLVHRQGRQVDRMVGGRQQQHPRRGAAIQVFGDQHAQRRRLAGAGRPPQEGVFEGHQPERLSLRRPQPSERRAVQARTGRIRRGRGQARPAIRGAARPVVVAPGVGHCLQEARRIEPDQVALPGRRRARVLQQELVLLDRHRPHARAALGRHAPPGGRAFQTLVEQRLGRRLTGPLALGVDIARLERHPPAGAVRLAAEHAEVVELGRRGQFGLDRRADVGDGHGRRQAPEKAGGNAEEAGL